MEAEVEVVKEVEVEEGLKADLKAEMVAEIVKQWPRKNPRIMGLMVEADTRTKEKEKVAEDHMIKEEFSAIIVKNMGTILMSVGIRTHQRRGQKGEEANMA